VIIFPNGIAGKDQTFHVGYTKYPENDKELRKMIGRKYERTLERKKKRSKEKTEPERQWKHFVKIARFHKKFPRQWDIFRGWLHDSDYLEGTDMCNEPKINADLWEQYSFRNPEGDLGPEMLFVELIIDWAQWVSREPNQDELQQVKKENLSVLAEMANESSDE
jgi:hypothetical protein